MSYIIAISGASGSGKTTIASKLKQHLSENYSVLLLSQDNYYNDQSHLTLDQREKTNYDRPDAFDHTLLEGHLRDLSERRSVEVPNYCFKTHNRLPEPHLEKPSDITIIEGLMLFNRPTLRQQFDHSAYIDTPDDICLLRRMNRDVHERGRTLESVTKQYLNTVRPMFKEHIEPYSHHAQTRLSDFKDTQSLINFLIAQVDKGLAGHD